MSRSFLSVSAVLSPAAAVFALFLVTWYSDLTFVNRVAIIDAWQGIVGFMAVAFMTVTILSKAGRKSCDHAYSRAVPVTPDFQSNTEMSLFKFPRSLVVLAGGSVMALAFVTLGQRILSTQPVGLISFPTLWLCAGLGLLVCTMHYSSSLSTIGPRIIYRYGALGLTLSRVRDLGPDLKVRFIKEVLWETIDRRRTRMEYMTLQLVDGSKSHVLSKEASPESAARVASLLGLSSYEELLLDFIGNEPSAGMSRLSDAPQVTTVFVPIGLWVLNLFAFCLPWLFQGALALERSPSAQKIGARLESRFDPLSFVMTNRPVNPRQAAASSPDSVFLRVQDGRKALDLEMKHGDDNRHPDEKAKADYLQALDIWNKALEEAPGNAYILASRGRLRIRLGQTREGLEDLEALKKVEPKLFKSHNIYGNCPIPKTLLAMTYWKVGEFDKALYYVDERDVQDSAVSGLVLTEFNRWEDAEMYLQWAEEKADRVDPEALDLLRKRLAARQGKKGG